MAPPPLPPDYGSGNNPTSTTTNTTSNDPHSNMGWTAPGSSGNDDWGNGSWGLPPAGKPQNQPQQQPQQQQDWTSNDYNQAGSDPIENKSSSNNIFSSSTSANTNQVKEGRKVAKWGGLGFKKGGNFNVWGWGNFVLRLRGVARLSRIKLGYI